MSQTYTQSRRPVRNAHPSRANLSSSPAPSVSQAEIHDSLREIALVLDATRRIREAMWETRMEATAQDEPTLPNLPATGSC
jgi:hypothetical protein